MLFYLNGWYSNPDLSLEIVKRKVNTLYGKFGLNIKFLSEPIKQDEKFDKTIYFDTDSIHIEK